VNRGVCGVGGPGVGREVRLGVVVGNVRWSGGINGEEGECVGDRLGVWVSHSTHFSCRSDAL